MFLLPRGPFKITQCGPCVVDVQKLTKSRSWKAMYWYLKNPNQNSIFWYLCLEISNTQADPPQSLWLICLFLASEFYRAPGFSALGSLIFSLSGVALFKPLSNSEWASKWSECLCVKWSSRPAWVSEGQKWAEPTHDEHIAWERKKSSCFHLIIIGLLVQHVLSELILQASALSIPSWGLWHKP